MDENLDQQDNIPEDATYATPFNVDLFGSKPKNFFTEYANRVLALPEPVKNILMDSTTAEFIEENLGPSFGLNKEQKTEVTRIIRDVLLGDISINEMAAKISENLGIDPTIAYQVQGKIVNELFGPAIEDIKKATPQPYRPPIKPAQPQYIPPPPPPRTPTPPAARGNVVDLRNRNDNQ